MQTVSNYLSALDSRPKKHLYYLLINVFLAAVIFVNAEICRLLGVKGAPLAISPVWMATGFSLAGLLIFGKRVWPAVFIGNLVYNSIHLFAAQGLHLTSTIASITISFGSLLQALVGYSIMHRFCAPKYFNTTKEVLIFLLPAGALACIIASTIGVATLCFTKNVSASDISTLWLSFWIGDTLGVYIITPLLVVWSLHTATTPLSGTRCELFLMSLLYIATLIGFCYNLPFTFFFFPICIWASYRFQLHGATLAIFLVAIGSIIPTSLGFGRFAEGTPENPLFHLVSFLQVLIATFLIFAAVATERESARKVIERYDAELEKAVELLQEKITRLSSTTSGLIGQIQDSLLDIVDTTKMTSQSFHDLTDSLPKELASTSAITESCREVENHLHALDRAESKANEITNVLQGSLMLTNLGKLKAPASTINVILNMALAEVLGEEAALDSSFSFDIKKHYDKFAKTTLPAPEELASVFAHFFRNSVISMKKKRKLAETLYVPLLEITTREMDNAIIIQVKDNGQGVSQDLLPTLFERKEALWEINDLGLIFARDLIVHAHHGTVEATSEEGEFLEFTISLPCE